MAEQPNRIVSNKNPGAHFNLVRQSYQFGNPITRKRQSYHHFISTMLLWCQCNVSYAAIVFSRKWVTCKTYLFRPTDGLAPQDAPLLTWISNHMPSKVWDEIIYLFPNLDSCTVEVWEWMSNYISMMGSKLNHVSTRCKAFCKNGIIQFIIKKMADPHGTCW